MAEEKELKKETDKSVKQLEDYRTVGEPSPKKEKTELPKEISNDEKNIIESKKSESAVKKADSKTKKTDKIIELERIYIIPLRKGFLKVPKYKRAKKAIKTLKEFLAKHMKVEKRDLSKVKVDIFLNNEIWFRGIKKPLNKVKIKAKKINGIVYAELFELPEKVKYNKEKIEKRKQKVDKKGLEKVIAKEAQEEKLKAERSGDKKTDKTEEQEKEKATLETGLEKQEKQAKAQKHTTKPVQAKIDKMSATTRRKALKK